MIAMNTTLTLQTGRACLCAAITLGFAGVSYSQEKESFPDLVKRLEADKPKFAKRHQDLLNERYDLSDKPVEGLTMTNGKPVQGGVRVKLPNDLTWDKLNAMSPEAIKDGDVWPAGFYPLPHPHHEAGGMVFPKKQIDEVKKQTQRDLTRFDLDYDLPDHMLPEFPAPIFINTRPDLGDVSKGQLVTLANFYDLFHGFLNTKQLDGLRLLLTPFPQAQFNATHDRRALLATQGVSCFDCHSNGHSNGATHTVGDIRPNEHRHRIGTPTLRGMNINNTFGSQRAMKSVEDFTEFEQRAAYFDGEPDQASRKGVNPLDRGTQVQAMAEFQNILGFAPSPKLASTGWLIPSKASKSELNGEALFHGKALCSICHTGPYFTDGLMHDLKAERFFKEKMINGRKASADGPIKTFALRGIKESPPYLHDDRLMTLEDTVEFFNVVLETHLSTEEKADLVAFLRAL
ncbi:cytochrome b6 [Brevifollis gellanilyticus]|uniref:Cytochrome b6 n=2 Tax=Brevifollis gellanilyticus TaxID=748831 RepID=A0A512MA33_9BACT|nr:cytochrome b6 [Brevifollis gellanilyticus]